jgi:hypothetical protein
VSDLKNIWRFFMQTQGLSFNLSAIFQTALVPPSLRQAPQIKEVSIKDRPFFCTELSPRFTLITYSTQDGVKVPMWVLVHHGLSLSLLGFFMRDLYRKFWWKNCMQIT